MKRKASRPHSEFHMEYLSDPEDARRYLEVAIEEYQKDGDQAAFLLALKDVVEAQMGFTELARRTGRGRSTLYEALSPNGNPRLDTMLAILDALGILKKGGGKEAA